MSTPDAQPGDPGHPDPHHIQQGDSGASLVAAWVAVIMMCVGFGLVVLALPVHSARLPLLITGGVIGLAGVITAGVGGLMDSGE